MSLGIEDKKEIEIINLKFDKNQALDFAESNDHIFPAYHMNKNNWITILLDGPLSDELILGLSRRATYCQIDKLYRRVGTTSKEKVSILSKKFL